MDCWTKCKYKTITKWGLFDKKNYRDGAFKSNSCKNGYHSKDIRDLNNLPETNQFLNQKINAVNAIHQISKKG